MNRFLYSIILLFSLSIGTIYAFESTTGTNQVSILRLDKDLLDYLTTPEASKEKSLSNKYPTLLPALAQTISNISDQKNLFLDLKQYFSHPMLMTIYKDACEKYDNTTPYEKELNSITKRIKVEFGVNKIPLFAFHVSGFKENSIYVNNTISLSIDKYLGEDYPTYKSFFSISQRAQMSPNFIARDYVKAWMIADFIKTESTDGNLLSEIIEQGKLLYTLQTILPQYTEEEIVGYTTEEHNKCKLNEKKVWEHILRKNHLYSSDKHIINPYFNELNLNNNQAETLNKMGSWIGLQIVKQYAEKTKASLKEIIDIDERTILKKSNYQP